MIKNTGAKNVSDESGKNREFDIFLISLTFTLQNVILGRERTEK
jgi:hypothetical protein